MKRPWSTRSVSKSSAAGRCFICTTGADDRGWVAARLRELLPDLADLASATARWRPTTSSGVMTEFRGRQIPRTVMHHDHRERLDIPNCKHDHHRGPPTVSASRKLLPAPRRVGRFKHQAYAYLCCTGTRTCSTWRGSGSPRLRQHNQLGAGSAIAMRDLELRGAGNLLGAEQSGHIVGVGFELYCQLLRQSVARLKGEKQAASIRGEREARFRVRGATGTPGRGRRPARL